MASEEITIQNQVGGELSPKMYGRDNLSVFRTGSRRCKNFFIENPGGVSFRPGKRHVLHARLNQIANLIKFQFNNLQAYQMEFTNKKLRFYRNNGIIVESDVTISAITKASPGVVTTSGNHGYENGDEVFLTTILGMTELSGKTALVANKTASTFQLTDVDGVNINTTNFGTFVSGVSQKIFEIDTPYTEANDLFQIKVTQDSDTMLVVHPFYEPRKLTRTDHTAWTLSRFTRTADPFLTEIVISGITKANPGVVTATGHPFSDGDTVIIEEVVGMVEVNSQPYIVANKATNTFELTDLDGNNVDTSDFTTYSSVGFASDQDLLPNSVVFYESRAVYGGPEAAPNKILFSRAPTDAGVNRIDDFTTGTDDDHAIIFLINSSEVSKTLWLTATDRLLMVGTFGSEIKITGATADVAITPTSITAKIINNIGVANVPPVNKENAILYIQQNGLTVRNLDFNIIKDKFISEDMNLVADHITESGLKQLAWQTGRPNIMWSVRNDGVLLSLTFKPSEGISPWARHNTGATGEDKFLSVSTNPRENNYDQVWLVTERVIDGNTRRYVGYFEDFASIPEEVDFFTGIANKTADNAKFLRAMAEAQKDYVYLDSSLTYDGSLLGLDASATLTPAATTGASVVFTASAAVFKSTDVGRQLWKKALVGVGEGRAEIITFTSTTVVVCKILSGADFDNTNAMAAGNWYLTVKTLSNLDHLEGREIGIITDGGQHPLKTVASGSVTLDYQSSKFHVGLTYEGLLQLMTSEFGGTSGPTQTKIKHIHRMGFRVLKSLGGEFGIDLYEPTGILKTQMPMHVGGPQPLVTGTVEQPFTDGWESDKVIYIRQNSPLPFNLQLIEIYGEANNE